MKGVKLSGFGDGPSASPPAWESRDVCPSICRPARQHRRMFTPAVYRTLDWMDTNNDESL